jgi:multicomponent Na+:H+ antiporter subunit A
VREGSRLSGFFAENSYILAHGRNIVNVIIVDFRALDTLGEITVLALAGVGVYTLLKLKPEDSEAIKMPEEG